MAQTLMIQVELKKNKINEKDILASLHKSLKKNINKFPKSIQSDLLNLEIHLTYQNVMPIEDDNKMKIELKNNPIFYEELLKSNIRYNIMLFYIWHWSRE